jgi:chemotaxis protein CheD
MMQQLSNIGSLNAAFAAQFLRDEGIRLLSTSLGGERARCIQYWPATGRARQKLSSDTDPINVTPIVVPHPPGVLQRTVDSH